MKTAEQLLAELNQAIEEGHTLTRRLHEEIKDVKTIYKHERNIAEGVLREETARAIEEVTEQVQTYLVAQIDAVVAEFRKRVLGFPAS